MNRYAAVCVVLGAATVAVGDLRIRQWNPNITSGFTIDEPERTISITTGHATEVFKFEAYGGWHALAQRGHVSDADARRGLLSGRRAKW